ncbi:hypothetical protein DRP07_09285 [Archaeoglobales archaeon]|nr:MAG: hypothetical protein DRP07_09285 [Archaeoglobales archaeon]
MVGVKTKWDKIQISATIYPEHARILEKILQRKYNKPIAHNSASEVIRRAIEKYAEYLEVVLEN